MRINIGDIVKTKSGIKVITAMWTDGWNSPKINYKMADWKEGKIIHYIYLRSSLTYLNLEAREDDEVIGSIFNNSSLNLYHGCKGECPMKDVGCKVCGEIYPRGYNGPYISDIYRKPGKPFRVNSITLDGYGGVIISEDYEVIRANERHLKYPSIAIDSWTPPPARDFRQKVCEFCVIGNCEGCLINKKLKTYGK